LPKYFYASIKINKYRKQFKKQVMNKKLLLSIVVSAIILSLNAQSISDAFFTKVSYVGAFGDTDWTQGWANFDPQNTNYAATTSTLGNGELSYTGGLKITADQTISGVVQLNGWVYVQSGATLTIAKGTIIRGESAAALVIERGGKIVAEGTATEPIVFTSNKPAGSRGPSDWAGVIICGKTTNNKGADVIIEGGVGATFGAGTSAVENDNSGILKYVRIEFPGYDIDGAGNEINGLTMGSVGSGTTIDYVQVSFSGDDAFEWFGGTVNAKHLIALATEDDDFDTDNGFKGMIQFILSVRDPKICDTDGARGFESDNDANSSYNKPYTSAVFSNVTLLGPGTDESANKKHDVTLMLRRNTRLQIYNLVSTGYVKGGVMIDGDVTQKAASEDSLKLCNSIFAGYPGKFITTKGTSNPLADSKAWLINQKNDTISNRDDLKIQFPVVVTAPVFIPQTGSPILTKGSSFGKVVTSISVTSAGSATDIKVGSTLQLTATLAPTDAVAGVVWSVDNKQVATVSESGLITAISQGTVVVNAKALDGSGISGTFTLTVSIETSISSTSPETITLSPNPFVNRITMNVPAGISGVASIELFDVTGKNVAVLYNGRVQTGQSMTFDVNLNAGIYFSRINLNNNISVTKLISR
jgi:hypothetical protein